MLEKNGIVSIVVHKDSTAADILQSFVHSLVMSKLAGEKRDVHMERRESELWIEKHYKIFISKLQSSGWKTERLLSPSIGWRAKWLLEPSDDKAD
nr:protein root UVB sensitive 3 isoform X1 [Ipomoea batatas]